jgi:hypothetical protein
MCAPDHSHSSHVLIVRVHLLQSRIHEKRHDALLGVRTVVYSGGGHFTTFYLIDPCRLLKLVQLECCAMLPSAYDTCLITRPDFCFSELYAQFELLHMLRKPPAPRSRRLNYSSFACDLERAHLPLNSALEGISSRSCRLLC